MAQRFERGIEEENTSNSMIFESWLSGAKECSNLLIFYLARAYQSSPSSLK
jgi:hypothetical protein